MPLTSQFPEVAAQIAADAGKPSKTLRYLSAADGSAGVVFLRFEGDFIANWSGSGVICQSRNTPWPGVDHQPTDEAGARAFIKHERYRAGFMRGKERDECEFDLAALPADQERREVA